MNVNKLESNIKRSFLRIKQDMKILKAQVDAQNKMIHHLTEKQDKLVKTLNDMPLTNYVGTTTTQKLHSTNCPYAKRAKETIVFTNREDALDQGYSLCTCLSQ